MKLIFSLLILSLLCFLNSSLSAREIIYVQSQESTENNQRFKDILKDKFNMPEDFIKIVKTNNCKNNIDSVMLLCLKVPMELEILKVDQSVVVNVLNEFVTMERK